MNLRGVIPIAVGIVKRRTFLHWPLPPILFIKRPQLLLILIGHLIDRLLKILRRIVTQIRGGKIPANAPDAVRSRIAWIFRHAFRNNAAGERARIVSLAPHPDLR